MIEVEVEGREHAPEAPDDDEIRTALELAFASAGVGSGHVAVHFVDEARSLELAAEYLGKSDATDVISFPMDGDDPIYGGDDDELRDAISGGGVEELTRELGDIVICPERTVDLLETVVHGALHLVGMDHEVDEGQMLAVQAELMSWLR
ncbi:MAG: rRNA maturation RNase YbeY [Solirubrobacteraceae bacterium]|nr:rRNA maturation RNase YbeY [Solirubrobacteraceae bacterium]